jgi:hypothetical protein
LLPILRASQAGVLPVRSNSFLIFSIDSFIVLKVIKLIICLSRKFCNTNCHSYDNFIYLVSIKFFIDNQYYRMILTDSIKY